MSTRGIHSSSAHPQSKYYILVASRPAYNVYELYGVKEVVQLYNSYIKTTDQREKNHQSEEKTTNQWKKVLICSFDKGLIKENSTDWWFFEFFS